MWLCVPFILKSFLIKFFGTIVTNRSSKLSRRLCYIFSTQYYHKVEKRKKTSTNQQTSHYLFECGNHLKLNAFLENSRIYPNAKIFLSFFFYDYIIIIFLSQIYEKKRAAFIIIRRNYRSWTQNMISNHANIVHLELRLASYVSRTISDFIQITWFYYFSERNCCVR